MTKQLSPAQVTAARKLFLGKYQCPYLYKCPFQPKVRGCKCPFAHPKPTARAMPLPKYVCVPYLLKSLSLKPEAYRYPITECIDEHDGQCRFGVHLTVEDMKADVADNDDDVQAKIEAYIALYPDEKYQCIICKTNIALERRAPELQEYAVLPGCDHVQCGRCIRWERVSYSPRCKENCTDAELVHYQRYEPTIEDKAKKAAIFADVRPELLPDWDAEDQPDCILDHYNRFKAVHQKENLCEVPRLKSQFIKWLRANMDNAAVSNLLYQVVNEFELECIKSAMEFWAPYCNEFKVPAWMDRDNFEYIDNLLKIFIKGQREGDAGFAFAKDAHRITLSYEWSPGFKFVLHWRTPDPNQNDIAWVRVYQLNGPGGEEYVEGAGGSSPAVKEEPMTDSDGLDEENPNKMPVVSYFRYEFLDHVPEQFLKKEEEVVVAEESVAVVDVPEESVDEVDL